LSAINPEQLEKRIADLERQLRGRKGGRDWDAYAAVIATLVGLLALAVSGYTAHLQRQQLRAQIWPKVVLSNSTGDLKLMASNWGTGPARVTAVRVTVDDKPMPTWVEVVNAFGYGKTKHIVFGFLSGRVLTANQDLDFAAAKKDDLSRKVLLDVIEGGTHAFGITLCYCSVLDECWVARYGRQPEAERNLPENECPVTEADQFHN
jgi:hypothetical protein